MVQLMQASRQWANRPDDERFLSLIEMREHFNHRRNHSRQVVVPSKTITLVPEEDNKGLNVVGDSGHSYAPNHWSFGQIAQLGEAPPGFLRTLPSPLAADCINYGLKFKRALEDVGLLLYKDGHAEVSAATGPNYGRVWNADVVEALIERFGDGSNGTWRVPGEFGQKVPITKDNTTLYAGDRDMFVFLADEENRIELPNRRNGKRGTLARGFFIWNSEVGKTTLGLGTFLFDYACCNRIVWGAEMYQEVRVRHTASAPIKWLDEVQPVLLAYANAAADPIEAALEAAQQKKIDDVDQFLAERFGRRMVPLLNKTHEAEEGAPIATLWDAATAVTAYARGIGHIDERVKLEREAGKLLALAA